MAGVGELPGEDGFDGDRLSRVGDGALRLHAEQLRGSSRLRHPPVVRQRPPGVAFRGVVAASSAARASRGAVSLYWRVRGTETVPVELDWVGSKTTLFDAAVALWMARDEGARCPCCGQLAKRYRRALNRGMASSLIKFYREAGTDWAYKPDVLRGFGSAARDETCLRFWDLFEEDVEPRPDGGRRGWWRVTEHGEAFIKGRVKVPKYALIYDGECEGLVGPEVGVRDCLATAIDLESLLHG